MIHTIITIQSVYYILTGIWPLIDIDSFQTVTGPKTDLWLVKTVGILVAAMGAAFLISCQNRSYPSQIAVMAIITAAGFIGIEGYYVTAGIISPIYILDSLAHVVFLAVWIRVARVKFNRNYR